MHIHITFTKMINTVVKNVKPNHWLTQKLHSNLVGPFQLSTVLWQTIESYGSWAFFEQPGREKFKTSLYEKIEAVL